MDEDIKKLCRLIEEIANNTKGAWQDRRDLIKNEIDEDALEEFVSWFTEDDDEGDEDE